MKYGKGLLILLLLQWAQAQFPATMVDTLLQTGKYDEILRICQSELLEDSTSYEALFNAARAAAFKQDYDTALRYYDLFLTHYPHDPDGHLGKGRVLAWSGDYPRAELEFLAVTDTFPDYTDAWVALGSLYLWWHQPEKAIAVYTRLLEKEPTNSRYYFIRGKQYLAVNETVAARRDLVQALKLGYDRDQVDPLLKTLSRQVVTDTWSAGLVVQHDRFLPQNESWTALSAKVLRNFSHGTGLLYVTNNSRYGKQDQALLLDSYFDLWPGAYGNWTHQVALGADFLPLNTYRLEIIQSIGLGWEASGSYGHMNFPHSNVDLYSVMGGKYAGNYYGRLRYLLAISGPNMDHSLILSLRRYLSSAFNFVDITTGLSTKLFKNVYLGDALSQSGSYFAVVMVQHRWNGHYLTQGQYALRQSATTQFDWMHSFLLSVDYLF
ncbi:MAG: YaiO family outer membrane beta-barrel protein [Candidatus Neomarinimicrobiota bacterium]|nr:MAG: YaiO family outer membrane beta-barrel protein [Candidatus Neomarinimicrobiota bacterium]